jgi:hypothetical protein
MRHSIYFLFFLGVSFATSAQTDTLKGKRSHWYFLWGYTKAYYSKSNIHFRNLSNAYNPVTGRYDYYDFTIYNATAHDRPDYDKIKDVVNITIPQYVGRIGYYFNKNSGIELNYDHTKYVVDDYQTVRVVGQFNDHHVNNDTVLDPNTFLHFEHTDGANFWMFNYVRKWDLVQRKNLGVSWLVKPGAGFVIPRTQVSLFGETLNNNWKLAGWIVGLESGFMVEFLERGVFQFVSKGTFADYVNVFVIARHGRANHHFMTGQLTATLGFKFGYR